MKHHLVPAPVLSLFLGTEGILYAVFLRLDLLGHSREACVLKYTGILLCLSLSLFCSLLGGDKLLTTALTFTAAADWFLLVRNDHLLFGILLFLCVQILYLLRLHRASGRFAWSLRGILAAVLLSALLPLQLATPLNLLAVFYFSQLLSNALLAWQHPSMRLFALGLALFVGGDICVGLYNILPRSTPLFPVIAVGMWFLYLPSQVLITLSVKEVPHENQ